ncbi:MAG: beta-aspartyl-peptidase [Candidatus Wallbacteria bacterium]|nr:beta-aspartyl-peptidase [Candidatus Wallbacteria bacterium]
MFRLIKNGELFSPDPSGRKDILLSAGKIAAVGENIEASISHCEIDVIDASNHLVVPGFIDCHVHLTGGGGEGGFTTRTPEIMLSDITMSGVTTVIGCLGTDGFTRSMQSLIAKAHGLSSEGVSTFALTGSYQLPVRTLTGSITQDIMMIDKVIGVGEIAVADHRSSQPEACEIAKVAAEARLGGMLSGKAGIVNIHMGNGNEKLEKLEWIVTHTEIRADQFLPTHINRNRNLLEAGLEWVRNGGYIDLTADGGDTELSCQKSLKFLLESGARVEAVTCSSDGQGSLPIFDGNGKLLRMEVGKVSALHQAFRKAVKNERLPVQTALRSITSSPASIYCLHGKGRIAPFYDADIVLLNRQTLEVDTVISGGIVMVKAGTAISKGTFEG